MFPYPPSGNKHSKSRSDLFISPEVLVTADGEENHFWKLGGGGGGVGDSCHRPELELQNSWNSYLIFC